MTGVLSWTADFFRLAWGLIYWNFRKSVFQLRKGAGRCPCQSPSDSGRGLETHCEACVYWAKPSRFKRLCPLLVDTPDGLRCSVDTPRVRPFWGRAIAFYAGGGAALAASAILLTFGALRAIGYPVTLSSVAVPTRWDEINVARGRYFLAKGADALDRGNVREAHSAFSLAYTLAPLDYDVGFAVASLWQITQPAQSDAAYARLMGEHPDRRDRTAEAWHRALLARADLPQVRELARREFLRTGPHAGYWINSLLFATSQLKDSDSLRELLESAGTLAPEWRKLLETELLARGANVPRAIIVLRDPWPEARHPYVPYYQVSRLIRLGRPAEASRLLQAYGTAIGADERYRLALETFAVQGALADRTALFNRILESPSGPAVELLALHLARHPHPALLERLFARLREKPLAQTPANHDAFMSLLCAAGVASDVARLEEARRLMEGQPTIPPAKADAFRTFFAARPEGQPILVLLSTLPLSLELTYFLLERYPPFAAGPAGPPA